ncbi:MAG: hypothetical protein KUG82_01515 [Pseudomonadales bacterium]|nr:hypothetical protein [Pseudomonadales bacterium]
MRKKVIVFLILFSSLFVTLPVVADIAVIVNTNNVTETMSVPDLKNIYNVRKSRFVDNSPIILSYQNGENEISKRFFELVVGRSMMQLNRFWATKIFSGRMLRPIKLADDQLVIQWISENTNGIGYIDVTSLTDKVKAIALISE